MKLGEKRKLACPPEDAYGPATIETSLPREALGELSQTVKIGDKLTMRTRQGPVRVTVTKLTDEQVTVQAKNPHRLGGKTLYFDMELVELKKKDAG
jgi:FKBP-type peptidyl-prolyl cis-trans isomerase 2